MAAKPKGGKTTRGGARAKSSKAKLPARKAAPKAKAAAPRRKTESAKKVPKAAAPKSQTAQKAKKAASRQASETVVTLIARDPVTAFAAWDTAPDADPAPGVLRVLEGDRVHQELDVSLDWGGVSIAGLQPGRTFRVELTSRPGPKSSHLAVSKHVRIGISNPVKLPGHEAQPARVTIHRNQDSFVFVTPRPAALRAAADPDPSFAASRRKELFDLSSPATGLSSSRGAEPTLSGRR